MTTINTSTSPVATAHSNQRKIDRCQNGVLWAFHKPYPFSTNVAVAEGFYSTDNGATWTQSFPNPQNATGAANGSYEPATFSIFIDQDDYAHLVWKEGQNGYIYYRRGTPNAGRTAWTWSAASPLTSNVYSDLPDIIAHREGTGWKVHVVTSYESFGYNSVIYWIITITAAGVITVSGATEIGTNGGVAIDTFPSIDFNHTGDGKTVAGGTPHLYVAWSAGTTGAGKGIRFRKAVYAAGSWTWNAEREIDSTLYISADSAWINCLFDGTRVLIAGYIIGDVVLYERDAADTTTTSHKFVDNATSSQTLLYGSSTYDDLGNVYFFGRSMDESAGLNDLVFHKWDRSLDTYSSETVIDSNVGNQFTSVKRGYSDGRVEFVYTDGTASPYTVTFDNIILNADPNTPTNLAVTSDNLDTTPVFSADISDPDSSQDIKGRFQVLQSDGVTVVGTVDSAFRTGAGTVTAEYASALAAGNYFVQAATVDDAGAVSSYSAQIAFSVKVSVETDEQFIWDTDELIPVDTSLQWDVLVSNQKDLQLIWNVTEQTEISLSLVWSALPVWALVVPDEEAPVTWEKVLS